jgi:hypothetical protein
MAKPTNHLLGLVQPLLEVRYAPEQVLLGRKQFASEPAFERL